MKKLFFILSITLLFNACSTLKVNVDYDTSYDFANLKSFAIVYRAKSGENTLNNDRITDAIEQNLNLKNYEKNSKDKADLIFTFHTNVENKTDISSNYQMAGFGRYRYGGAMISTPTTYSYNEGTLIIDALDPKTKKVVWRTIATDELDNKSTPDERTKYLNEIVGTMMKDFPIKGVQ
ncbi:MAG: DUF4136 domain-containing protein [Campylobacterota bacterium]|nr:DUF4136 domain-containing protein [Campylobacterota bacterium]